ncbi:response regulator [Sphingomonas sp. CLY1604]|uniref:response regulator n=1 Tax=Sphingomonas sp. CLY1604 TaxID=3457786 RepID=UPI003FD7F9AF
MAQSEPRSGNTILIVEGEALIRFDVAAFFEERDWRVFEAEDADQAVTVLDRHADIPVALIDATVGGRMDGLRLAHHVRELFPPTLLFVVSGLDPVPREALPERATFLSKPFDPHRVLRQIGQGQASP